MSPTAHLSLGDRVRPSVEWMMIPMDQWGTVVRVEHSGKLAVYTVDFDSEVMLRCFGFMLRREMEETERAN